MKPVISLILIMSSFSVYSQTSDSDILKVVVETKFGELTFSKVCDLNKFEFVQSKDPIFDIGVEREALEKNIERDTLKVKFSIDKKGKIISFEIIKKSRIDKLNSFLLSLFEDAIIDLKNKNYSFNCNNKESLHTMPLIYVRQKSK